MAGGDENNKPSFSYIGQRTVQPFQPRYGYFPCGINDDTATACAKIERWLEILSSKNKDSINNIFRFIDCIALKYTSDKAGTICNLAGESENVLQTDFIQIPEFVNPVLDACQNIPNPFNSLDSVVPEFLTSPEKIGDILPTDQNGNYYFPIPSGVNTGACIAEYFFEGNDGIINNINASLFDVITDEVYTPVPDDNYSASPGELALGGDYPDIFNECFLGGLPIFTQCEVKAIWDTFTSVDGSGARSLDLNANVDKKYKKCRKNLKRLNKIFNNDLCDSIYTANALLAVFWCQNTDIIGNFETTTDVKNFKEKLASINTQITDWTNTTNNWGNWISAPLNSLNCLPTPNENFVGTIFENYIEPTLGILPPGVDIQIDPEEGIEIDIDPNQTLSEILGPVGSLFLPPDLPTFDLDLNTLLTPEGSADFCNSLGNLNKSMREMCPNNKNAFDIIDRLVACLGLTPEGSYYIHDENDNLIKNPNFSSILAECLTKGLTLGQKVGLDVHLAASFLNQYWTNTGRRANQLWNFVSALEVKYESEQVGDICSRVIAASQMIGENGEWKTLTKEELCQSRSAVFTYVTYDELSQLLERRNLIDEYCLSSRNNVADFLLYSSTCEPITFCTATPTLGQSISEFVSQFLNKDCIALSTSYFERVNNISTQSQRLIFGPPKQYKIPREYCNLCPSNEDNPSLDDEAEVPSNPIIDEQFIITFPPYPMPGFGDGAFDPPNITPPPPSFRTCASFTVPYNMPMYTVAQYFRDDNGIAPSVSQIKEVNPELALVSIVTAGTVVKAPSPYCNRVLSTRNGACYIIVDGITKPVNCPGEGQFNLDPERPVLLLPPSNDGVNLPFNINITE